MKNQTKQNIFLLYIRCKEKQHNKDDHKLKNLKNKRLKDKIFYITWPYHRSKEDRRICK